MHFAVHNSSLKQVDIIRTLLELGGDINCVDFQGKTPLHHASEASRIRCIPVLIKKKAAVMQTDQQGRTAIQLAPTDRVREIITCYYDQETNRHTPREVKNLIHISKAKVTGILPSASVTMQPAGQQQNVNRFVQQEFIELMRKIQQEGVNNNQYLKKPYLFTGSWLEGLRNLEDLFIRIKQIPTVTDAALRVFNVLQPFQGDIMLDRSSNNNF